VSPKVGVAPLRREQIVRATIRCLAREGYSGLTMKKVARLAGMELRERWADWDRSPFTAESRKHVSVWAKK